MELMRGPSTKSLHETVRFLLGLIALASLTALCLWLDFRLVTTASLYFVLIVVLSLAGSLLASIILSFIAGGCLAYFFAPPIFDFRMYDPEDIITTAAFLITSLVVTGLVRRGRAVKDKLRQSEAYLAEAQRITRTGSFAYDVASRRMIHSSAEHHRLFGFDPAADTPGLDDWVRRIHPEDRETATRVMEQKLREATHYKVDFRIIHPDGKIRHIHSESHSVSSPSGDLVEIVGTSTDVTDRRRVRISDWTSLPTLTRPRRHRRQGLPLSARQSDVRENLGSLGRENHRDAYG